MGASPSSRPQRADSEAVPASPKSLVSTRVRRVMSAPPPTTFPDPPPVWVYVKAKTRSHNSSRVTRKTSWFEAKAGRQFTIGRNSGCDFTLDDDRVAEVNAKVFPAPGEGGAVCLQPESRMYRLVGMGVRRAPATVIRLGSVIKVGSVSLQVTQVDTDTQDNFMTRFQSELSPEKEGGGEEEGEGGEGNKADAIAAFDDAEDTESVPASPVCLPCSPPTCCDERMCYICWSGDGGGSDGEEDGEGGDGGEGAAAAAAAASTPEDGGSSAARAMNPLIRNPCGKCSGSSKWVHLQCILHWIKSSGSGHCSICNGALPAHFSCASPNIELKVIRHRRGHSWVGTRRFRLSFAQRQDAIIGRNDDAQVRLGDRSVCGVHARIRFNREESRFELSDCASFSGTFVQVTEPFECTSRAGEPTVYLKIGRTILSMKVTYQRRNSVLMRMLPSFRRSAAAAASATTRDVHNLAADEEDPAILEVVALG